MDGKLGKEFLVEYSAKVSSNFSAYLEEQVKKSEKLGSIPIESLEQFNSMVQRGKMLRGALIVLGYLASGGKDLDAIYDVSTFIEIYHTAILIHDDFMDRDPFRRGMISAHEHFKNRGGELGIPIDHAHYGNSIAVNLGNAEFYISWDKLLSANFPSENIIAAGKLYAYYSTRLALGQILDVTITGSKNLEEKDVLNVIWTKSGEYTSLLPLQIGFTLAGLKDEKVIHAIENYARCFGWAFHIQDDVLGMFGQEEEVGKPVGSDIREGKNTLLMLYLDKHGTMEQLEFKKKVLGNSDISKEDVEKMRQILKDCGSYDHVINMGWNYVEEGKKYIPDITDDPDLRNKFESLLVYMMERTK